MKLRDLLLGQEVVLRTSRGADWVSERINEASGSIFNPFHNGISGWARLGRVSLHKSFPMFSNGFQPIFYGRMVEEHGYTVIKGRFGIRRFLQVFLAFLYTFLLFVLVSIVSLLATRAPTDAGIFLFFPALALFGIFPLALIHVSARMCAGHLALIQQFLEREVGAVRQPDC